MPAACSVLAVSNVSSSKRHLRLTGMARNTSAQTLAAAGLVSLNWLIRHPKNSGLHNILCQRFTHALVQNPHHLVDLLGGRHQRGAEGDPVGIETAQEAVVQGAFADLDTDAPIVRKTLFGGQVLHELHAEKQPFAANVADNAILGGQALEAPAKAFALGPSVGAQV